MITLTSSVILDHCWICHNRSKIHNHHVIPQAFGGKDGPLVTLCADHHNCIHDAALACYPNKLEKMNRWLEQLPIDPSQAKERFYYLVEVIMRSRAAATNDPNKKASVVISLTGEENRLLSKVCDHLSSGSSRVTRPECMLYALRDFAAKLGIK